MASPELMNAMQAARQRQMTHYDSYGQDRNPNDAFNNTSESWAHGIYNSAPNLMRMFESAAPYTLPGMLSEYANPGGGKQLASAMLEKGLGTDLVNESFTPQSGYQKAISFAGEAAADPTELLALPYAGAKFASKIPDIVSEGMRGLRQSPWKSMEGIIGSTGAKTADLDKLDRAIVMNNSGHSVDDIYAETKWWLGHPDGRARFEIDDSAASMGDVRTLPEGPLGPMGANLEHNELYQAYPDTRKTQLFGQSGYGGKYDTKADNVTASNQSVTLHELQHAIQERENMARGANPDGIYAEKQTALARIKFLNDELSKAAKDLDKYSEYSPEYQEARHIYDSAMREKLDMNPRIVQSDPFDSYQHFAGEAEARLVQDRMNMTMNERLANPFYKNFDVPLDEQIIRMK